MDGVTEPGIHEDYVVFYSAGQLIKDGRGDEIYNLDSVGAAEERALGRPAGEGVLVYLNPPFFAAAFVPLTALPLKYASLVIFLLGCLLAVVCAAAICAFLGVRDRKMQFGIWFSFLALASVPWLIAQGQSSLLLFIGWLGFAYYAANSKQSAAGASLALTLIKPQYALIPLFMLIWNRQWKALATLVGIAAVLGAVSIAVSGPDVLVKYPQAVLESMRWYDERGIHVANMYGWNGYFARLLHSDGALHNALTIGFSAATVGVVAFASKEHWKPGQASFYLLMALALLATLLISDHFYLQDLSLLALVLTFVGKAEHQRHGRQMVWIAFAAAIYVAQLYSRYMLNLHDFNLPSPIMAVLFVAIVVRFQREKSEGSQHVHIPETTSHARSSAA